MPDYPKFGIWSDGYYFTINQFANGSTWAGAGVCVLDRAAMLVGNANATMQFFDLGTSYGSLLPADCDGATLPPAGTSNYFLEMNANSLRVFKANIDWNNSSNSTVTIDKNLATQPFSYSNITIEQPGTSQTLMALSDRLMYRLQYRNFGSYQVMLANHTVNADGNGRAGIRWYELRNYGSGWSIYQQGTYAPDDGENRWMASIAMNSDGDIALGYSVSSTNTYPSIRFAGQNSESSGTGILDIAETSIFEGSASQTGINRWGDYSAMTVDPNDDDTFWFTTEYSTGGWNWRTRIASFSFAPIVDPPVTEFSVDDTHPMVAQTVSFTDESTNVPSSWSWTFSPSSVTFVEGTNSASKNPKVQFNSAGFYTVTLTATNDIGSDTEIKSNFIEALDCSAVTAYPYLETFDEWALSVPEMSCTDDGSVVLDDCWINAGSDDIDWDILTDKTSSGETGPDGDHTSGEGNYLYTESSSCYNHTGYLISPAFNLSSLSNPELSFWYHMYGAEMGTLSIQASTNGGSTWSSDLWSMTGDQGNQWNEAVVSLAAYNSATNVIFRITGLTGSSWHSDMALDDFSVTGGDSSGTPPTANAGEDQEICENSTCQLDGSAYNSSDIEWSTSGDGSFSDVNDENAIYTPGTQDISNGTVTITLIASPIPPATATDTDDMLLTIREAPSANAGPDAETCEGVGFTVSGASASNYNSLLWSENGTGTLTGANTLTPTYTPGSGETGQVTLTLTAQGLANCADATSSMTLDIISGPTADAGSDGTTCEDFSYTINDASAANYSSVVWTENGTGYLLNGSTLSPTYVPGTGETGIVTLTLTAQSTGSCGNAISTMQIEINPAPTASAGVDDESCNNASYTITGASATNGTSLLWTTDGAGNLEDETTLTPIYTPESGETGDVTFTLTVYGQGTCNDAVSNKVVEFFTGPTADAGSDASVCEGNSFTVTDATASDYVNLQWISNGTGNLTGANTLSPTYTPGNNETGTIVLTLTAEGDGTCGDAVSVMQLEISGEPTADAGPDGSTCAGNPYTINGASADNVSSLLWTTTGTGSISEETTLTPTYTPGVGESGDITLTLTVEGQGDCSDATSAMTLSIQNGATADAGSDASICEGNTYTITDADADDYTSLQWTSNGTGSISNENSLTPTYTPGDNETGIITLTLTAAGQGTCGDAVSTMDLEIFGLPSADAGPDDNICAGDPYTISGASSDNGSSLLWTTTGSGSLSDATTLTPTYTPGDGETGDVILTLTVEGEGDCGNAESSMTLNIQSSATADAGLDASICEGYSYTVTDATADGYTSLQWTSDGTGSLTGANTLTPTYTPGSNETGIVTLTLTALGQGYCGDAESTMELEIFGEPTADAGPDGNTCEGISYTISGASSENESSLLWTTTGSGSLSGATTLTPTYTPGNGETGDVTLTMTVQGQGDCSDAVSGMILSIHSGATADAGSDASVCEGNAYTVTDAMAADYTSLYWTSDGTGSITGANTLTPTYNPGSNETGIVTLTLTALGQGYCGDAESTMELEIYGEPMADAGPDGNTCEGVSYTITGAFSDNGSSLQWTSDGTGYLSDATTLTPTYTPSADETGDVILTLTVLGQGDCSNAESEMTLHIIGGATADAGNDAVTCEGTAYTVNSASAEDYSSLLWTTNGAGTLTGETTISPTYIPANGETGDITLILTVYSEEGGMCGSAGSSMILEILPSPMAFAGGDDMSCQGDAYTISGAIASSNSTYLWTTDGSGMLDDETTLTPTYIPAEGETGNITLTLTVTSGNNGYCGTASSSMNLEILPGAIADAGPDDATCENSAYMITGASASENSTILWTSNGMGTISDATTISPTYHPATGETGLVTMLMTVTSGGGGYCGIASSTMDLEITELPYADAGPDAEICQTDTYTISGASASQYSAVLWTSDGSGILTNASTLTPTYEPGVNEEGEVTLTLTVISENNGMCGSETSSMTLNIIPGASADAGPDIETCEGTPYTVTGATASTNSTILWTTNGSGTLTGASTLTPTYTPANGETGEVILTLDVTSGGGGACGTASSEMIIDIIPVAYANAGEDAETCQGTAYTINDASASSNSTLLWTSNGSGTLIDETTLFPTYIPGGNETGNVTITLTVSAGDDGMCGSDVSSMTLNIIPGAVAYAGPDGETCEDASYTVSGASASDGSTIEWATTGEGDFVDIYTLTPTYTPADGESGEIYLTLIVTSGGGACGTTSSTSILYIYPAPFADAGEDDITCQGDSYTVTTASASENSTFLWTSNGIGTLTDETTLSPTYTPGPDENGTVSLTLTVTSAGGMCGEATSTMLLEITPGASAYAGMDGLTCMNQSYTVSGATASSNSSILWSASGSGTLSGETTLTPTYTPANGETGDIILTLEVTSAGGGVCGVAISEMILSIYPEAIASAGNDIPICEDNYAELNASALNYSSIEWISSGDGYFDDVNSLTAFYYPGDNDIISGQVTLTLNVYSLACDMATDDLEVLISLMPYTDAGEDGMICYYETYQLSGYAENEESVLWTTTGDGTFDDPAILDPVYTPGQEDIDNGDVRLLLTGFGTGACDLEVTDEMILTIETCTSVQPNSEPGVEFRIMPNPANEYVKFTIDNLTGKYADVSLINMVGDMVKTGKFEVVNGSVEGKFILIGIDQGVYFIRIVSDNYYNAARLIKLK